ncbi:MAG: DUF2497 domain-containing protein [Sphingosinicella sp.]|nr:DUF2497 domain-containing protein [Sphingosinicella sp.]
MGDTNRNPSMEEILASIKRVIAEETPPPAPRPARTRRLAEDDDVLELSDPVSEENGIISNDAATSSRQALAALAEARRNEETEAGTGPGGPLDSVVREMLRPMLKQWLDENLPDIVEELVTREIARITGKHIR